MTIIRLDDFYTAVDNYDAGLKMRIKLGMFDTRPYRNSFDDWRTKDKYISLYKHTMQGCYEASFVVEIARTDSYRSYSRHGSVYLGIINTMHKKLWSHHLIVVGRKIGASEL